MRRHQWIICLILFFIIISVLLMVVKIRKSEKPNIHVTSVETVNYNNYIFDNHLDYKKIGFAYHSDSLLGRS